MGAFMASIFCSGTHNQTFNLGLCDRFSKCLRSMALDFILETYLDSPMQKLDP